MRNCISMYAQLLTIRILMNSIYVKPYMVCHMHLDRKRHGLPLQLIVYIYQNLSPLPACQWKFSLIPLYRCKSICKFSCTSEHILQVMQCFEPYFLFLCQCILYTPGVYSTSSCMDRCNIYGLAIVHCSN